MPFTELSAEPCCRRRDFATAAIHAGYSPVDDGLDAVVPPIFASAAFDLETAARGDRLSSGIEEGFAYSRVANPTVDILERRIAALEGGTNAVAVGSGMAAVSFALLGAAEGGGRLVAPTNLYGASVDAMASFFPHFGVRTDFVKNINDPAEVEAAIGPDTRAVFAESIANPSTEPTDVRRLADIAHRHGIPLIVDNTVPTPALFRPIEHGADVVVHSTTKGICGHGNAVGGVIVDSGRFDWSDAARFPHLSEPELVVSPSPEQPWDSFVSAHGPHDAYIRRIRTKYVRTFGAVLSPFNAYLQLVGLETLDVRTRQEVRSATAVAQWLLTNPHVTQANYSGLALAERVGHAATPADDIVRRDFPDGVGTILSFEVEGGRDVVDRILDGVEVFTYVPNIGDVRSMIVDPARITHREVHPDHRAANGVTDTLIRLSIGLESPADLIADLSQAFEHAYR
ncbi:O-acetylhomoserine aminocarboxypropyltransferase/cysteine synthase family protein [Bifidobacterium choloepi]|uniref:homocysteine desulfhydrase n=1 Tax=Bifidobacterium choloepi TaxID=2614131 RepID=A0A6I5NLD2_9BIFI|nr:PLP-dependent transferase [Bifidobacterium choloepi]NEG69602.1 O-acetylhomoserine aminocarboxypropyltransferase/cysteine synthase [Bifidobacterium choloepi]